MMATLRVAIILSGRGKPHLVRLDCAASLRGGIPPQTAPSKSRLQSASLDAVSAIQGRVPQVGQDDYPLPLIADATLGAARRSQRVSLAVFVERAELNALDRKMERRPCQALFEPSVRRVRRALDPPSEIFPAS